MLYNIRLTMDIRTPGIIYKAGTCMKATYWQSDGTARPYMKPGLILQPDQFEFVFSDELFERLLTCEN